ncbi:ester cyclase [Pararoseomonas indoligenes]|uniref:Ester cyclase n=1 Tax=Roseomonas indoligenes TaxID=2820811 RepID=A0A940N1Q4_9PROT|nr:ester cyclase [Pararoseomonas indoligenes]MBP0495120.1 ester cyclase [Pararoseomonas indoligenes]
MTSMLRSAPVLAGLLLPAALPAAAQGVPVKELVVAAAPSAAQRTGEEKAARAFYDFWNTGDEAVLRAALSPAFTDHTLPPGRPQGAEGPAFASRNFRGAVPDLRVSVEKMIIAGDYVTVHMHFTGHFTGRMGDAAGQGQPIDFIATDLIRVTDGLVTDNWHIEDNLTLLQQMGLVPKP